MTKNVKVHRNVRRSKGERGVGLLEIVIVLAVVLVIAVVAVPRALQSVRAYKLASAVSTTNEMLADARISAIKRNRTTWLTIDRTARTMQVHTTDSGGNTIDVGYAQPFPQGVNLNGTTSINISFDSLGRSSAGTQTFTVVEASSRLKKDVTVSPAGKISVSGAYLG